MKTLADFRDIHKGQSIIVCGLGESLPALAAYDPSQFITIGVNDIGRYFQPDYLVLLDKPERFTDERWKYIAASQAKYIFTCIPFRFPRLVEMHFVPFQLGRRGGTDLSSNDSLPYTTNSPYVALCLAAFMGASRIGLIGVDFTGNHMLNRHIKKTDREYQTLYHAFLEKGHWVYNLSAASKLMAFPKISIEEFTKW